MYDRVSVSGERWKRIGSSYHFVFGSTSHCIIVNQTSVSVIFAWCSALLLGLDEARL